jgi:hypothetical protein
MIIVKLLNNQTKEFRVKKKATYKMSEIHLKPLQNVPDGQQPTIEQHV